MARSRSRDNGSGSGRSRDRNSTSDPYRELSRENREGHQRVERSLREAERIANDPRPTPSRSR
jgi:hypothetical protein